ncbi:MAG: dnaX 1 [Planctomycetaceae bacterium]|nr:dnaX 1 [Planctomycetaceae bacterium]
MSDAEEPRHEYTVLARRFRPQAFADVVGQEHVAQALRNSIIQGRVAHAFLFTGARGVGKTSSARILAKSLNCPNAVGPDPCNHCEICQGISTGGDVDVLEIDGASNRGIDDIRMLRQNVSVRSMRSKYKIYIIDEVHMLTKEAFNALLKTLEEPPPNVKFIFCTTEPNKVPDTILSRCQRFDFGTIATSSIKMRLMQIAEAEGKIVDPDALELVARRAAGSMRDSQSLFDQLLAFGEEHIRAADVHRLLGTAPDERLIGIMQAVINRQQGDLLQQFQMALEGGVQLGELTDQLLSYTRDLLIVASGAQDVPMQSIADENYPTLKQQATAWGLRNILAALQILADTKGKMRGVNYGRALAELALVRLSLLEDLNALEQVIAAIRSGQFAVGGAVQGRPIAISQGALPGPSRPAPLPSSSTGAPVEKKNDMTSEQPAQAVVPTPVPIAESTPSLQTVQSSVVESALPVVELQAGKEAEFFSQLLERIPVMLKGHLKNAVPSATSGPNQLVLGFEKRYDLARQYCERRDNLDKVREIAVKLAGRPITVSFRQENNLAVSKGGAASEIAGGTTKKAAVDEPKIKPDPFVLRAAEVFHGRVGDPTAMG